MKKINNFYQIIVNINFALFFLKACVAFKISKDIIYTFIFIIIIVNIIQNGSIQCHVNFTSYSEYKCKNLT